MEVADARSEVAWLAYLQRIGEPRPRDTADHVLEAVGGGATAVMSNLACGVWVGKQRGRCRGRSAAHADSTIRPFDNLVSEQKSARRGGGQFGPCAREPGSHAL